MSVYIEQQFRVHYYLDTNILVDFSEGQYPNLKCALEFLADCPYVDLHSSMYVLYEYAEVRKYNEFKKKLNTIQSGLGESLSKTIVKSKWKVHEYDYSSYKAEIETTIKSELQYLEGDLEIGFHRHLLKNELVLPVIKLFLNTHISKEDSMVLLSSIMPNEEDIFENISIVTRDHGFKCAFDKDQTEIQSLFLEMNRNVPHMINTNSNVSVGKGLSYDLYNTNLCEKIEEVLKCRILMQIKLQLGDRYLGYTEKIGNNGNAARCISFISESNKTINIDEVTIAIIPKSLDFMYEKPYKILYWKNGSPSNDNIIDKGDSISFIDNESDAEKVKSIKEKDCIVIIRDVY